VQHLEADDESVKQVAFADVILLNKTDLVPAAELDQLETKLRNINAMAKIYRTANCDIPIAKVLNIGGFSVERATEVDPKFLEPEYPFEWAGAYPLAAGAHQLVIGHAEDHDHDHEHDHGHDHHHHHHGNENELDVVILPIASLETKDLEAARDLAVGLFSDWENRVKSGEPVTPGKQLHRLLLDEGNGTYPIEIKEAGLYLVFEGCGEEPLHLLRGEDTVKPTWQQDFHGAHEHNEEVTSVGISESGNLDGKRLNEWISGLLRTKGGDIYRMKGVLSVKGTPKRLVFQGVHMLFDAKFDREWGKDPRQNTLVFIGKNLDRAALTQSFKACLDN
jgi:G3E family GTPase